MSSAVPPRAEMCSGGIFEYLNIVSVSHVDVDDAITWGRILLFFFSIPCGNRGILLEETPDGRFILNVSKFPYQRKC